MEKLNITREEHLIIDEIAAHHVGFVFPFAVESKQDGIIKRNTFSGMGVRELLAGMALQGILSDSSMTGSAYDLAESAVRCADALLRILNEPKSHKGQSES